MPIPFVFPPEQEPRPRPSLHLVPALRPWDAAPLAPRAVAHFLDLLVVQGVSVYSAKVTSLVFLSFHMEEVNGPGRALLFQDALAYGQGKLFWATFLFLSLAYFVALPRITGGRTLGLGLMGCRIESEAGGGAGIRSLLLRQLGCFLVYATGGLLALLPSLKGPRRPLVHDRLSGTKVVKGG